ncbi:MAG: hypothetical protein JWR16_3217 [Nevskia sp.]|nr:hypothetical protein [Nevskia sp.]
MHSRSGMSTLMAVGLFTSLSAHAEDGSSVPPPDGSAPTTTLQQVTVTARRREEHLADVPMAATVIGGDALADRGIVTDAQDLLTGVPGVRFFDTTSPVNSEVSIRGSSTARGTNADPSVGLYRDGAFIGGGQIGGRNFTRLDLFDVSRVEVLRGTQGALYGRDAVGGAVNVISAPPEFHRSGSMDIQFEPNVHAGQVQAVVNEALSNQLALRFGLDTIHQSDGFFYDTDSKTYFDTQKGYSTRAQIRWRAAGWDINLLAEHQQMDVPSIAFYVHINPGPGFPQGFYEDPYKVPFNTAPRASQDLNNGLLSANYNFDWAKLTSTTQVRQRKSYYQFDADGVDPTTLAAAIAQHLAPAGAIDPNASSATSDRTTTFSEDVHLAGGAFDDRLRWLAGGEFLYQASHFEVDTGRSPTKTNPSIGSAAPGRIDYRSIAAYGSLGYDFTHAFNLTGEVRYTNDDKRDHANRYDRSTGVQTGGDAFNFAGRLSPSNVSYNATASYKLLPQLLRSALVYAKAGSAYRAGGFNGNLGTAGQPRPVLTSYGNEKTFAYELGVKGDLSRNIYVGLAGYRTHTTGVIVQTDNGCGLSVPECPVAPTAFLINGGNSDNWGLELEGTGLFDLAGGKLRAVLGGSHQQAEIKSGDYAGQNVPQVPHYIASADLDYRHPFYGNTALFGSAHYAAQWGGVQELVITTTTNGTSVMTPNFRLHDFQIVDARAGVDFVDLNMEVAGFVRNAGDVVYITYEQTTTRRLSEPLTWGVEMRYRW